MQNKNGEDILQGWMNRWIVPVHQQDATLFRSHRLLALCDGGTDIFDAQRTSHHNGASGKNNFGVPKDTIFIVVRCLGWEGTVEIKQGTYTHKYQGAEAP